VAGLDRSLISGLALFQGMTPAEQDTILRGARSSRYPKESAVFEQDAEAHSFFVLLDGHIRVVRTTPDGQQIIARYIGEGEIFGVAAALGRTTYPASAIAAVMTGGDVDLVTGRGTGIDDAGRTRKVAAIERAIALHRPDPTDPIGVLAAIGGLEIGVLVGTVIGAAAARIPVVLDGFITGAAALIAVALQQRIGARLIAAHRSVEQGHAVVLEHLGLEPILDLDLRLGEGSGAALAMYLIGAAVRVRDEMATFESASVAGPS